MKTRHHTYIGGPLLLGVPAAAAASSVIGHRGLLLVRFVSRKPAEQILQKSGYKMSNMCVRTANRPPKRKWCRLGGMGHDSHRRTYTERQTDRQVRCVRTNERWEHTYIHRCPAARPAAMASRRTNGLAGQAGERNLLYGTPARYYITLFFTRPRYLLNIVNIIDKNIV